MVARGGRVMRRGGGALFLAALFGAAAGLFQVPAGAAVSFTAVAVADGLRLTMTVPNGPGTDTPVDGGGPTAQAAVSSSGTSKAFASLPYPGEIAVTTPGLLAAVGVAGVPQYPLYQGSDYPSSPTGHLDAPGYRLDAASEDRRSRAEAAAGAPDGRLGSLRAAASVGPAPDGSVLASAEAVGTNLHVGDLIVGESRSRASVGYTEEGTRRRSSDFRVTGLSVAGTTVVVGPDGLVVGGNRTPVPAGGPAGEVLAAQGVRLEYLRPEETDQGVVSAGLRVTLPASPGAGGGAMTLVLGRASASVNGVVLPGEQPDIPPLPDTLGPGGDGSVSGPSSPPAATDSGAVSLANDVVPAGVATAAGLPSFRALPEGGVSAPPATGPPSSATEAAAMGADRGAGGPVAQPTLGLARTSFFDATRFYPALVLAAGFAFAALGVVGRMRVKE